MKIIQYNDDEFLVVDNWDTVVYVAKTFNRAKGWIKTQFQKEYKAKYEDLRKTIVDLLNKNERKNYGSTVQFSWSETLVKKMKELEPDADWDFS